MSFLSVSSKKTRVHLSPENLSSITSEHTHGQQDDCISDVAILPIYKSFIQISKSSKITWINVCKIKKEDDKESINICVKSKAENLSAIAASKKKGAGLSFANGYSNGLIKIRDLQTNKVVKEFPATSNASSVLFLDFNSCDEHLASVHEDGLINVYGMQTSVKLQSFKLDNQSTLARFHPQKRSHLGVASYGGKVTLLDIYAKKAIFKDDAHSAPCSDITMSEDFFLSSGYDSIVKIYDLRKKSPGIQIQACYGWSSISLSKCGIYFVGGNMKGELISYDMRNIKKPLTSARIENSNYKISRVAFLSSDDHDASSNISLFEAVRQSLCKIEEDIDVKPKANDDFIEDISGFQRGRISDFSSSAINHGTRVSLASRRSSTDSLFIDAYGGSLQDSVIESPKSPIVLDDSYVTKSRRRLSTKDYKVRSSVGFALQEINEEINDKENDAKCINSPDLPLTPALPTSPRFSSTPTVIHSTNSQKNNDVSSSKINKNIKSLDEPITEETIKVSTNFDFRKEFDALAEKIHIEVGSMNMDQNMRYIKIMSHIGEQRQQLQNRIQMIEDCMTILMNEDFKINMINDLQAENQQLRIQVADLLRRLSH